MNFKKIVSGILAAAVTVTSVFAMDMGDVTAEGAGNARDAVESVYVSPDQPIGEYTFDDTLENKAGTEILGNAKVVGIGGEAAATKEVYETVEGADKAVNLNRDYAIELPVQQKIGTEYTISVWLKATGYLSDQRPVLCYGKTNPEQWVAVSGEHKTQKCRVWWSKDGGNYDTLHRDEASRLGYLEIPQTDWTLLTISQKDDVIKVYRNGALVSSASGITAPLNQDGSRILIGAALWNRGSGESRDCFPGMVNNIKVYNKALTEGQVVKQAMDEKAFQAVQTESLTMYPGKTRAIKTNLSSVFTNIRYTSNHPEFADVDANGVVTAKAAGSAEITTTATLFGEEYQGKTQVTVKAAVENSDVVVDYDLSQIVDQTLKDKSPYGNDAAVHGNALCNRDAAIMSLRNTDGNESYVDLPMGIMDSLTDPETFTVETKFSKTADCADDVWLFGFGSKKDENPIENVLFFSPNSEQGMKAEIVKDFEEKAVSSGMARADQYYKVDMVFDKGKLTLYVDGKKAGEKDTGYRVLEDVAAAGTENNILGYIGKSCRNKAGNFDGNIASFKIYDRALTEAELFAGSFAELEDSSFFTTTVLGENADMQHIVYDLNLPGRVGGFESVTWESAPNMIAADGKVFNPKGQDTEVKLTAKAKRGELEAAREFTVRVIKLDTSGVQEAIDSVTGPQEKDYTAETWAPYAEALAKANQVLAGEDIQIGQKGLAELLENLKESYGALVRKPNPGISISKASIKAAKAVYTGKALKPKVTVKYQGKTLKSGKDYTVKYRNNKKVGQGSVVIKGMGSYSGSKTVKFDIVPKVCKISKLTNKKSKQLEVKFSKSSGAAGYEIVYAVNNKFKSAKTKKVSKTTVTLKNLKKGKTYYVKVRAYKKIGKKFYYSEYSKVQRRKIVK